MTPKFYLYHFFMRYKLILLFIPLMIIIVSRINLEGYKSKKSSEAIDAVYTWVNGSDPSFILELNKVLKGNSSEGDLSAQRFNDKYELKFSLRSLDKYAPWIRHVYIVTNGQIPYWLNLDCDHLTLITHDQIFVDPSDLPSFSSPAIEAHLHRIPGISKRFVYLNDDVFFGEPVYPDDFYNSNHGYGVYLTWPIPPCSIDCPWMYVNDGQCDGACYNQECQWDGDDCTSNTKDEFGRIIETVEPTVSLETSRPSIFLNVSNLVKKIDEHNRNILRGNKQRRRKLRSLRVTRDELRSTQSVSPQGSLDRLKRLKRLKPIDAYSGSLQYTNRQLNEKYGYKIRYVPAHAPIMIDTEVMDSMQIKFQSEFKQTSSNRIRRTDDLQFSFSYYYFLMQETSMFEVGEIFDIFDTDKSGTWSDREIRTLLTKLYELPLSYGIVDHFDSLLMNCTQVKEEIVTPEFERYVDSKLPTISRKSIERCPTLVAILKRRFGSKARYKFHVVSNSHSTHVQFKMLSSNVSEVVGHLDEIRRKASKFVCLNDNLRVDRAEDNELVQSVLYDFYLSLFPLESPFELSPSYRNRFSHVHELAAFQRQHLLYKYALFIPFLLVLVFYLRKKCRKLFRFEQNSQLKFNY